MVKARFGELLNSNPAFRRGPWTVDRGKRTSVGNLEHRTLEAWKLFTNHTWEPPKRLSSSLSLFTFWRSLLSDPPAQCIGWNLGEIRSEINERASQKMRSNNDDCK